ncbi:unnamed protein product [Didymodactylos carnosus]|uniref:Beta-1,4-galactosyltransferase n=1 Tax=Didymodactylos carnosus TaxID=1234261 RepID=A0A814QW26_9BILA|nr:unnamed protein product [Didymodactylos carnosus]CAF1233810.1 unnamed protein product [Didymodactylos carnosus]CAF3888886.1 unnamed protein product [Didymodactylos carnosus]CAF4041905.1 unnamed protein product [Didymodactylos carnosus]
MLGTYRQDKTCVLCLLCTLFMIITSIFNIVFIVRRSMAVHDKNNIVQSKNSEMLKKHNQVTFTYNRRLPQQSSNVSDPFDIAYRNVVGSFINHIRNKSTISKNYCPPIPPDLQGPIPIIDPPKNFTILSNINSTYHPHVQYGGSGKPTNCLARHKVGIIVPYRNRLDILEHFLYHTHALLQRQQIDYRIYVCEQAFNKTFNKGIVMNACFKEILLIEPNTQCFIFHDVDLLLIDDRNMYTCPMNPRHLSVAIDKFQFYLPYSSLVGGVLALRREHYLLVNGYSTNYWGWGGEDDDMYSRIVNKQLKLERPPAFIARYKMLKHLHQKLNPARLKVLRTAHIRIDLDGVNNVKCYELNSLLNNNGGMDGHVHRRNADRRGEKVFFDAVTTV